MRHDVIVFSPIAHTAEVDLIGDLNWVSYEDWIPFNKPFMEGAVGCIVAMMWGWDSSLGVAYEIQWFKEQDKPIEYLKWPRGG